MRLIGSAAAAATLALLASTAIALPHLTNQLEARADKTDSGGSGSGSPRSSVRTAPGSPSSSSPYRPPQSRLPSLADDSGGATSPAITRSSSGGSGRYTPPPLRVSLLASGTGDDRSPKSPSVSSPVSPSIKSSSSGSPGAYVPPHLRNSASSSSLDSSPTSPATSTPGPFGRPPLDASLAGAPYKPSPLASARHGPTSPARGRYSELNPSGSLHTPTPFSPAPGGRPHSGDRSRGNVAGSSRTDPFSFSDIFQQGRPALESPPLSRSSSPDHGEHHPTECEDCAQRKTGIDAWQNRREKEVEKKEKAKSDKKVPTASEVLKKLPSLKGDLLGSPRSPKTSPKSLRLPRSLPSPPTPVEARRTN